MSGEVEKILVDSIEECGGDDKKGEKTKRSPPAAQGGSGNVFKIKRRFATDVLLILRMGILVNAALMLFGRLPACGAKCGDVILEESDDCLLPYDVISDDIADNETMDVLPSFERSDVDDDVNSPSPPALNNVNQTSTDVVTIPSVVVTDSTEDYEGTTSGTWTVGMNKSNTTAGRDVNPSTSEKEYAQFYKDEDKSRVTHMVLGLVLPICVAIIFYSVLFMAVRMWKRCARLEIPSDPAMMTLYGHGIGFGYLTTPTRRPMVLFPDVYV